MDAGVLAPTADLQRVLETISGGMLVVDADQQISFCNREFSSYFGTPPGRTSWVGLSAHAALNALAPQMADEPGFRLRMAELSGADATDYAQLDTADGRAFERDYLPILDNGAYCGHVWHYWDVTGQRTAERRRERRLRAELVAQRLGAHAQRSRADEAERTGQDLAERNRALLETDVLRKELLATASHELRTPLTTILSYGELLADDTADDPQLSLYTSAISRNAQRLLTLVDDLLLLARFDYGASQGRRAQIDLTALLGHAVEDARVAGSTESIVVVADLVSDVTVTGDRDAIGRALANVLGNAVKYSHRGGTVHVSLSTDAGVAVVVVQDQGIGIPPDELEAIFGQFFRASTAKKSGRPGTGLGLPIVRRILDEHDGSIRIRSEPGLGTLASVNLPLSTVVAD